MLVAPATGAAVARAAALAEADGPAAGLLALGSVDAPDFQPWWAVRAALLARAGADSAAAYDRAIALSPDPAVRAFLESRRDG